MDVPALSRLLVPLAELARVPRPAAEVGGKAAGLARLVAAGLPVPDALVITTGAAELDEAGQAALFEAITTRAAELGERLVVRSSAAIEDGFTRAAPGVFASIRDVTPDEIEPAVRRVWASARTPLVKAYLAARGDSQDPGQAGAPVAVIVQRQVSSRATLSGVIYTQRPGSAARPTAPPGPHQADGSREQTGDDMVIELAARGAGPGDRELDRSARTELFGLARRAEEAIAAPRGADVEWVADLDPDRKLWIVQARPIIHPQAPPPFPLALLAFSRAEPDVKWCWDVTHNPDPLSPAQAGLIERMDALRLAGEPEASKPDRSALPRMRVVGGYLYVASEGPDEGHDRRPGERSGKPPGERPDALDSPHESDLDAACLRQIFDDRLVPAMNAALARCEAEDCDVVAALAAYEQFYIVYAGQLGPLGRRARRALPAFLEQHGKASSQELASQLLADGSPARLEALLDDVAAGRADLAALLAIAGPMATAWDVAAPTFAEQPDRLVEAVARRRAALADPSRRTQPATRARDAARLAASLCDELGPARASELDACLALARTARDIGELDARLYFRAQAGLRGALHRQARRWQLAQDDDIFFLPLADVLSWLAHDGTPDPIACHRKAQAARAMRDRQRAWRMPLAFAGGQPVATRGPSGASERWTGEGTGGQARGVAVRIDDLDGAMASAEIPSNAILVVATATPGMLFLFSRAAGVVAEHGGLLDHGAAMARELGLPCVVACAHAWQDLRSGDELWLDGDQGVVIRLRGDVAALP